MTLKFDLSESLKRAYKVESFGNDGETGLDGNPLILRGKLDLLCGPFTKKQLEL
jgi:hypothetical protein